MRTAAASTFRYRRGPSALGVHVCANGKQREAGLGPAGKGGGRSRRRERRPPKAAPCSRRDWTRSPNGTSRTPRKSRHSAHGGRLPRGAQGRLAQRQAQGAMGDDAHALLRADPRDARRRNRHGSRAVVLKPLWTRAPETASRLSGRIEAVLDAAKARGHIGRNEATLRAGAAIWTSCCRSAPS